MSHRDPAFQALWQYFAQSTTTFDALAEERRLLPDISFIIPIDDARVMAQCQAWQQAFTSYFAYDSHPAHFLHITLHHMGELRRWFWQCGEMFWWRRELRALAEQIREAIERIPAFDVQIGPLNSFPTALIAEVHDPGGELDALRETLKAALPPRAWPPPRFSGYLPHVTLGYWGEQAVAPLAAEIEPYRDNKPLAARIRRVKLTVYARSAVLRRDVLVTARETLIAAFQLSE